MLHICNTTANAEINFTSFTLTLHSASKKNSHFSKRPPRFRMQRRIRSGHESTAARKNADQNAGHFVSLFLKDAAPTTQTFQLPSGNPGLQNALTRVVHRVQIGRHRRSFVDRYEVGQLTLAPLLTTFRTNRRRVILLKNESLSLKHHYTMVFHNQIENPRFVVFRSDSLVRLDEM